MGKRGPKPKPPEERRRVNSPDAEPEVELSWDGVVRGPELPLGLPGIKWCTQTIRWWENWRNSAQAMIFVETDWDFLLDTALLYNMLWSPRREAVTRKDGSIRRQVVPISDTAAKTLAGEIRMRCDLLGGTPVSRQKQGMKIKTVIDEATAEARVKKDVEEVFDYLEDLKRHAAEHKDGS